MTHFRRTRLPARHRFMIRAGQFAAALLAVNSITGGCLNSDIAKRFRSAYVPGLVSGLATAVTTPDQAEAGLRQSLAALIDGLGAVLTPRE